MPKILIVEDSPTQALRLRLVLEKMGLAVVVAQNGQEGLDMAGSERPDALVLDVNLPDINGFQVCERLKQDPTTDSIPVVMLTVKDRMDDTLTGLDVGADAYIPKDDFAEANLLQALRDLGLVDTD
ncbi:MAG: response regulator [Chloroflexia bacterium]|nr:response regulator [Chloroflexia bacterium]